MIAKPMLTQPSANTWLYAFHQPSQIRRGYAAEAMNLPLAFDPVDLFNNYQNTDPGNLV